MTGFLPYTMGWTWKLLQFLPFCVLLLLLIDIFTTFYLAAPSLFLRMPSPSMLELHLDWFWVSLVHISTAALSSQTQWLCQVKTQSRFCLTFSLKSGHWAWASPEPQHGVTAQQLHPVCSPLWRESDEHFDAPKANRTQRLILSLPLEHQPVGWKPMSGSNIRYPAYGYLCFDS